MNLKKFVLINFLILILMTSILSTDNIYADSENIDNEVIGISFKDEKSSLKLAITQKETYTMGYPFVDWYIFGNGEGEYINGDFTEKFTLDGLTVYHSKYELDSKNDITIKINDKEFNFKISVVKNMNYTITENYEMITIGSLELDSRDMKNILSGAIIIVLGFIIALRLAKKSASNQDVEL